ncbi:sulfatase-like hydrolase/transferase [Streptomyces sp. NPDC004126]|uniref:sulfatase-like hydrolase/transferase n=1 Tax=Streptomyces sp. NPDC004126 TaxID=3390695 RepID=UPI003D02DBDA
MSTRRTFLAGSTAALGLAAGAAHAAPSVTAPQPAAAPGGRPPNLVAVLADDLGYGELGAYGQKLIATPRLDGLAAEGLRFTDAYSTAAGCAPSRGSCSPGSTPATPPSAPTPPPAARVP